MEYSFFVTNVLKHVDKCEKWACSTLKTARNNPIYYVMKKGDFKRYRCTPKMHILCIVLSGMHQNYVSKNYAFHAFLRTSTANVIPRF